MRYSHFLTNPPAAVRNGGGEKPHVRAWPYRDRAGPLYAGAVRILHTHDAAPDAGGHAPEHPVATPPASPAAATVTAAEAAHTELSRRLAALEASLAEEKASHARTAAERRDRETRIAELEDALRAAREPQPVPIKARAPKAEKAAGNVVSEWLTGTGRFATAED